MRIAERDHWDGHRPRALDRADAARTSSRGSGRRRPRGTSPRGAARRCGPSSRAQRLARGPVLGLDGLRLHDRRGPAVDQAELDELGAPGLGGLGEPVVDGAVVDGVLVEAELDVALDGLVARARGARS